MRCCRKSTSPPIPSFTSLSLSYKRSLPPCLPPALIQPLARSTDQQNSMRATTSVYISWTKALRPMYIRLQMVFSSHCTYFIVCLWEQVEHPSRDKGMFLPPMAVVPMDYRWVHFLEYRISEYELNYSVCYYCLKIQLHYDARLCASERHNVAYPRYI